MTFDIPQQYEPTIQEFALTQHISTEEALDRIIQAGLERYVPTDRTPVDSDLPRARSYASFFGVAIGRPGAHGSREAVDRYIAELRNEW